jgi:hypothetical protein
MHYDLSTPSGYMKAAVEAMRFRDGRHIVEPSPFHPGDWQLASCQVRKGRSHYVLAVYDDFDSALRDWVDHERALDARRAPPPPRPTPGDRRRGCHGAAELCLAFTHRLTPRELGFVRDMARLARHREPSPAQRAWLLAIHERVRRAPEGAR